MNQWNYKVKSTLTTFTLYWSDWRIKHDNITQSLHFKLILNSYITYLDRGNNEIFISAWVYDEIASFFKLETRSLCSRMWSSEEWPKDPFIIFLKRKLNQRQTWWDENASKLYCVCAPAPHFTLFLAPAV